MTQPGPTHVRQPRNTTIEARRAALATLLVERPFRNADRIATAIKKEVERAAGSEVDADIAAKIATEIDDRKVIKSEKLQPQDRGLTVTEIVERTKAGVYETIAIALKGVERIVQSKLTDSISGMFGAGFSDDELTKNILLEVKTNMLAQIIIAEALAGTSITSEIEFEGIVKEQVRAAISKNGIIDEEILDALITEVGKVIRLVELAEKFMDLLLKRFRENSEQKIGLGRECEEYVKQAVHLATRSHFKGNSGNMIIGAIKKAIDFAAISATFRGIEAITIPEIILAEIKFRVLGMFEERRATPPPQPAIMAASGLTVEDDGIPDILREPLTTPPISTDTGIVPVSADIGTPVQTRSRTTYDPNLATDIFENGLKNFIDAALEVVKPRQNRTANITEMGAVRLLENALVDIAGELHKRGAIMSYAELKDLAHVALNIDDPNPKERERGSRIQLGGQYMDRISREAERKITAALAGKEAAIDD